MILVLENEVVPANRYFVPEIHRHLGESEPFVYPDVGPEDDRPSLDGVDGVIVSGSTAGVYERDEYPWMESERAFVRELIEREIPTLGVCFGHQLVNDALGGSVEHRGLTNRLVEADLADDPLFDGVSDVVPALHGDHVVESGDGMAVIGSTDYYEHFATRHVDAPVWTVQFHPEFGPALLDRIRRDFGWEETAHSFEDVATSGVFENFERLASE